MDALPIKEETGISFESVKTTKQNGMDVPIMHACGHDIHMTSLIGTAEYFSKNKDSWKGTIVFILQPAEEIGFGARQMINAGLFKNTLSRYKFSPSCFSSNSIWNGPYNSRLRNGEC